MLIIISFSNFIIVIYLLTCISVLFVDLVSDDILQMTLGSYLLRKLGGGIITT